MADAPPKPNPSEESPNLDAMSASEASGVVDAIDRHRTKILGGIAVGAIALCGVLVGTQLKKQKHLAAAAAYTSAVSKGEIAALDAVLVDHPGSIPAGNALLSKADLQIDQGKPEDARATLERFVGEFHDHPRYAQGIFALANLFHVSGDREMAKSHYEKVISVQADGELTPLARIRLGDLALESGDTKAADQLYQDSYTLHPGNPFFEYAEEKLDLLKVGNPPEVDKPAPKPEPVPEAPKTEAPKVDAPKVDAPKVDAPKVDAPKVDAPKVDAPKVDAPKVDAPKVDAPKVDAPKVDAPKVDAPKVDAPKVDAPKVDAPKVEAPKVEAPKVDAPKVEAPKVE